MRTKIFLIAVLAGMLSLTSNAGSLTSTTGSARIEKTEKEVGSMLHQIFKNTPLEDLIEKEETVQVRFSVNENNEMTNVKVHSRNKELENYVSQVLKREKVTLTNANPDEYSINLVFDIK